MPREKGLPDRAYLLRCWQEGEAAPGKEPHWRFSLEEVLHERRRKGFDSLEALVAFLRAELTGSRDEHSEGEGPNPWGHASGLPDKAQEERGGESVR
jgi:hypothetical protein